jgi:hypothetical protein
MVELTPENIKEITEYTMRFTSQLGNIVSDALDMMVIGHIKAAEMYSVESQMNAAHVGFQMGLQVEIAIVLYIYLQAYYVQESIGFLGRLLPGKNKKNYRDHVAVAKFIEPIFLNYKDTEIFPEYMNKLTEEMRQRRTKISSNGR